MFPNLKNTEVKTSEYKDYLSAGAHTVQIKAVRTSDEVPGYQGTPFFEFTAENDNGSALLKFMGVDSHTSEAAARVRTEIFKSFLMNAGATNFENGHASATSIIGKTLEVCLASREYWTTDKDTDKPVIRTRVEYKFSNPKGKIINFKDSYNKSLSAEDRAAYERALEFASGNSNNTVETPF